MDNAQFDYSYQYSNWHNESIESETNDKNHAFFMLTTHNAFPHTTEDNILEIGCGMGRLLLMLQENGYSHLRGVDIDASQIRIAQSKNLDVSLSDAIEFLQTDTCKYHAIYAFDVLEHIAKDRQLLFLQECFRHLHDNGFLVLQFPNAMSPTEGYYRYQDFTHTCSYTKITAEFLLRNAGFSFISVRPTHHESKRIQNLKLPWANLYREEFGLQDIILTPNLFCIAFKNKEIFTQWHNNAPILTNAYPPPPVSFMKRMRRAIKNNIKRFFRHCFTLRF